MMEARLEEFRIGLESRGFESELAASIDVTFPSIAPLAGSIHPVRRIIEDSCAYFRRHGFAVVVGPEAEPDYYNFDALNIPNDHPARENFDSFWLTETLLLRPHTSPIQIRTMQRHHPPIAIVAPGKCFRRDAVDARHLFQFHQVEGLLVAEDIHFGHLKGMLAGLCRELFGPIKEFVFALPIFRSPNRAPKSTRPVQNVKGLEKFRRLRRRGTPTCAARFGAAACAAVRDGSSSEGPAWYIRTCCGESATIPTVIRAGRSVRV